MPGSNPSQESSTETAARAIRRATPEPLVFQNRRQVFVFSAETTLDEARDWVTDYQESVGNMIFDVTSVTLPISAQSRRSKL